MRSVPLHHAVILIAIAVVVALPGVPSASLAADATPSPLVVIDPGHGGRYSNANANGIREKTANLYVALELRRQLLERGYRVKMTRTTDRAVRLSDTRTWNYSSTRERWYYREDGHTGLYGGIPKDDLQARTRIANQAGADLFISIHANGSVSSSSRGTETYASRKDKLGRQLAPIVHRRIVSSTGLKSRGAFSADFYVVRWTNMPAILVESAFITNRYDAWLLKQSWFRTRIAKGIANGVDQWMATEPYRKIYPRVSGDRAASLSTRLSATDYPAGASVAVIARADRASELPGAPGLAVKLGAPLLWSGAAGPGAETASELARLAPQHLVLLGTSGSFDETAVAAYATASGLPTSAVEVVEGADRSALAVSIAESMSPSAIGEILVVDGSDASGRLIAAPVAAAKGLPLLLADEGVFGPDASDYLATNRDRISRLVLVGSATRLPSGIADGLPYKRVDGVDIAQRAAALNARYFASTVAGATRPVVATYSSPTSYLTAATRAGRTAQPLIPVGKRTLPMFTREWISNRRSAIAAFTIIDKNMMPYLMDSMLAKADCL